MTKRRLEILISFGLGAVVGFLGVILGSGLLW